MCCVGLAALLVKSAMAAPDFEHDVKPIFEANCFSCHGATSTIGLDLRTATSILRGSYDGPVVLKGAAEKSLLYEKVSKRQMPPSGFNLKLTDAQINTIKLWIDAGLPSQESETIAAKTQEETARFEKQALPIFKAKCFGCHGTDQPAAKLDLRSLIGVLKGSEAGPVVSDRGSDKSLLLRRVSARQMPPPGTAEPLTESEVQALAKWIDTSDFGLLQPRVERTTFNEAEAPPISEEDRRFWAFRKPLAGPVPVVKNKGRVRTSIDAFLLAKLEAKGLSFSPDAPSVTLMRRAYLDLMGLPPSPEEIQAFLADHKPRAYERLIDKLLASPHYGERWGRHWLDAAGYAEDNGPQQGEKTAPVMEGMWRYRDWVIRALNEDQPFDQFLTDQLAGDELVDRRDAKNYAPKMLDKLVATGYLRTVYDRTDPDTANLMAERYDVLFHLMEKVSTGLMGLTVGCARCHSHKYDPIPQRDYYRMMAIFTSGYNPVHWMQPKRRFLSSVSAVEVEEIRRHNAEIDKPIAKLKEELEILLRPSRDKLFEARLQQIPEPIRAETREALATTADKRDAVQKFLAQKFEKSLAIGTEEIVKALNAEDRIAYDKVEQQINTLSSYRRSWDRIQALWDVTSPPKIRLLERGEVERPGPRVEPGFPEVLSARGNTHAVRPADAKGETSGYRLAFARWLTGPDHPLTARVMVNRVWQHHFGRAIVETPDNFGKAGASPTHPELLDWLAVEFMKQGWSMKKLHKLIMTSTAYRQSSEQPSADSVAIKVDPENRLLWRVNLRRLEAETVRDAIMAVSGKLDRTLGGPSVEGPLMADGLEDFYNSDDKDSRKVKAQPVGLCRRSVYVLARRYFPLGFLETFDAPILQTNCSRRVNSVSPLQSLTLMNNDFVLENTRAFAARVEEISGSKTDTKVQTAYLLALSRKPTSEEFTIAESHLQRQEELYSKSNTSPTLAGKAALESLCHLLLLSNEFLYLD
jgi:mono/diheme cytochrome c family protein